MLTVADANVLANQHLAELPPLNSNYRLVIGRVRELPDAWYFDYRIEHVAGLPPEKWDEQFAGAPGFTISKTDGLVQVVSWHEYQDRGLAI